MHSLGATFGIPELTQRLKALVKSRTTCLDLRNDPPPSPLYPLKYPEKMWDRIHVDFAECRTELLCF